MTREHNFIEAVRHMDDDRFTAVVKTRCHNSINNTAVGKYLIEALMRIDRLNRKCESLQSKISRLSDQLVELSQTEETADGQAKAELPQRIR